MATMAAQTQRLNAIERANAVKFERLKLKREIHALTMSQGKAMVADIIEQADPSLSSMRVLELLLAVNRLGKGKARNLMLRAGREMPLDPWVRIGDLSAVRRAALAGVLREER